jgi:hypothetical protein
MDGFIKGDRKEVALLPDQRVSEKRAKREVLAKVGELF